MFRLPQLIAHAHYRRSPTWRVYQNLLKTQHLSREELEVIQLQKLQTLSRHAVSSFPFWKQRFEKKGLHPNDLSELAVLQELPVLEKHELPFLRNKATFYARDTIQMTSGGSTGVPVTIHSSTHHVFWSHACLLRFYEWMGFKLGEPRAKIFAAPTRIGISEYTLKNRLRNFFANMLFIDALDMGSEKTELAIQLLKKHKPKLIMGYTSSLRSVARALIETEQRLEIPNLVIMNAAEQLDNVSREVIETGFEAPIFDHYGTREVGNIADEITPGSGLRVHMEYLIVEIVDENGRWVDHGEEGDILITQLENYASPVLRYRIGDRAIRSDVLKADDRGLQVIPAIVGRSLDFVVLPSGTRLTGLVFPHIFKDFQILEYMVIQKSTNLVVVRLVLKSNANQLEEVSLIRGALEKIMPGVTIELDLTDKLPRNKSGKLQSIVSEIEPIPRHPSSVETNVP